MSNNFSLSVLRAAILKLQQAKIEAPVDDIEESDVNDIAESIIKDSDNLGNKIPKLNLGKRLSNSERGLYLAELQGADNVLGAKGMGNSLAGLSVSMVNQLVALGVIELSSNGSKITKFNAELASKILGSEVSNWDDFYKALQDNSYGYYADGLDKLPSNILDKYFVGPILEYESQTDKNTNNYCDLRYTLNQNAIKEDFADYPGTIESPEDLQKALEWKTNNTNGVNGEIDEWVEQGGSGDCWLISAILALNATEAGKKILKDSIKTDGQGNVTITFYGIKTADGNPVSYTITKEELLQHDTDWDNSDRYSNGDNDMLAMELAVEKLEKDLWLQKQGKMPSVGQEIIIPNNSATNGTKPGIEDGSYIEGGHSERLIFFLTGVVPETTEADFDSLINSDGTEFSGLSLEQLEEIFNEAADGNVALTIGFYPDPDSVQKIDGKYYSVRKMKDVNGKTFTLYLPINNLQLDINGNPVKDRNGHYQFDSNKGIIGHALIITNVDKENRTATIVNPWDSNDEYVFTWEQCAELGIFTVTSTNLNGVDVGGAEEVEEEPEIDEDVDEVSLDSIANQNYNSYDDLLAAIQEAVGEDKMDNVFITAAKQQDGSFKLNVSYINGDKTAEATVTISQGTENEVALIKNNALPSKYANVLNAAEENKVVELYSNLLKAESGDISALLALRTCGLSVEINNAVKQQNNSFKITVKINGESFTFSFDADKEDALIEAGLYAAASEEKTGYSRSDAYLEASRILNENKEALKEYYGEGTYFDLIWDRLINQMRLDIFSTPSDTTFKFSEADVIKKAKEFIDKYKTADSTRDLEFSESDIAELDNKTITMYLIKQDNGKYKFDVDRILKDFPDKNIKTINDLKQAVYEKKNSYFSSSIASIAMSSALNRNSDTLGSYYKEKGGKLSPNEISSALYMAMREKFKDVNEFSEKDVVETAKKCIDEMVAAEKS